MTDNKTKRLFLAIQLNQDLILKINQLRVDSGNYINDRAVRWTVLDNLHLTLVFIGDTPFSSIPLIENVMNAVTTDLKKFEITFKRLGFFPNQGNPRIFWMGLDDVQSLRQLYNKLVRGISPMVDLQRARFSPHVTIARINNYAQSSTIDALKSLTTKHLQTEFGTGTVDKVVLFESNLQSAGPVYKMIYQSMLK